MKEKAAEAAKVGSEYAEKLGEKAVNAAEVGNEYLAQSAEKVKEYATLVSKLVLQKRTSPSLIFREYADEAIKQGKVLKEVAKEKLEEVAAETIKSKKINEQWRTGMILVQFQVRKNSLLKRQKRPVNMLHKPVKCCKKKFQK